MVAALPDNKAAVVLTVNAGSSSIKFAVYAADRDSERLLHGQAERVGTPEAQLSATNLNGSKLQPRKLTGSSPDGCARSILAFLRDCLQEMHVIGIGHRIVQGGLNLLEHQAVSAAVMDELRSVRPVDLGHLPQEIALIEQFALGFPGIPQFACFDTAFHRHLPRVAQLLPIPRQYLVEGVRRFGFHGLSYTSLMNQLASAGGNEAVNGRVILAHLGSGASMAAVHFGKPADTTMSFTPTSGLVMGTRPGDIDAGLLIYLMRDRKLSIKKLEHFVSHECGLLGVSGRSADLRDLQGLQKTDTAAADAINFFCYTAMKHLAALTATLGGLDTLVFAGGIGEHSAEVRSAICANLAYLGVRLDPGRNKDGNAIISAVDSPVCVRVMHTDEELVIVRIVRSFLDRAEAGIKAKGFERSDQHNHAALTEVDKTQ